MFKRIAPLALFGLISFVSTTPTASATTLTDFAVLGYGGVQIGAGSTVNGNVGSGDDVSMNGGSTVTGFIDAVDEVHLANAVTVGGIVTNPNSFTTGAGTTVGGHVVATPVLPALPPATAFVSGGSSVSGGNGTVLALAPGSYADLNIGGASDITLTSGDYFFDSFNVGNGLDMFLDLTAGTGNINIYITGIMDLKSVDLFFISGGDWSNVYIEAHHVATSGDKHGFIATGADFAGTIYTPYAGIHYGGSSCCSTFTGFMWAGGIIDLEHGVTVTDPHLPEPATLLLLGAGLAALPLKRRRDRANG